MVVRERRDQRQPSNQRPAKFDLLTFRLQGCKGTGLIRFAQPYRKVQLCTCRQAFMPSQDVFCRPSFSSCCESTFPILVARHPFPPWALALVYNLGDAASRCPDSKPATASLTPQLSSYPLPPRPYACTMHFPSSVSSFSSRIPFFRVGRLPTMSAMIRYFLSLPSIWGYAIAKVRSKAALTSGDGFGSQLLGSFVPPMMVPPSKLRGTEKDHEPSAFCRVTVAGHEFATRHV